MFTPTYPSTELFDGTSLPYYKNGGIINADCGISTSKDPYFILQMDNNNLNEQGWAQCGGKLSYPNNLFVYNKDGELVAGDLKEGITTEVINTNPIQLMVVLTSLTDLDLSNGYVLYKNDSGFYEDPFIQSSFMLYLKDEI